MSPGSLGISLIGVVACLALAAYALVRLPRDGRTNSLALLCFAFGLVHLDELICKASPDPITADLLRSFLHGAHSLASVAGLLFVLHYTGLGDLARSRLVQAGLWGWWAAITVLQTGPLVHRTYVWSSTSGWVAHYDQTIRSVIVLSNFALTVVMIALLIRELRVHWSSPARRRRTAVLVYGGGATIAIGTITDVLLPLFGFVDYPRLLGLAFLGFLALTVWAVGRYGLLSFSMEAAAWVALDRITDAVLVLDADQQVLYANPKAGEIIGDDALDAALATHRDAWRQALRGGVSTNLPVQAGSRTLVLALAPLESDGRSAVVAVFHDDTEVQTALAEARAANEAKSRFLANMSHELRTPLNAVIGYAEMLAEDAPEHGSDLDRIESSGRYLLSLINDILDLSKLTSGRLDTRPEDVDLATLVDEAAREARPLADKAGAELVVEVPDAVRVHADPLRTKQIVLNLLSNAAKFSRGNPVRIEVHPESPVRIAVIDAGIGMDDEQLGRLFGAFEQVHREGHDTYGGTGLGLALSRELARQMGGDIEVTSAPGVGSTFVLSLPSASATSASPPVA